MSTTGSTTSKVTPSPLEADGTPWLERLREDMILRDFRPRTQEAYELGARLLVRHFGRPPEELGEEDLRSYFLHMRDVRKVAPSTLAVNLLLAFQNTELAGQHEINRVGAAALAHQITSRDQLFHPGTGQKPGGRLRRQTAQHRITFRADPEGALVLGWHLKSGNSVAVIGG